MSIGKKKLNSSTRLQNRISKIPTDLSKCHEISSHTRLTRQATKILNRQGLKTEESTTDNIQDQHAWTSFFLPNPETGAWNQMPLEYQSENKVQDPGKLTPHIVHQSKGQHSPPKSPRYSRRTRKSRFGPSLPKEIELGGYEPISSSPNTIRSPTSTSSKPCPTGTGAGGNYSSNSNNDNSKRRTKKIKTSLKSNQVSKALSTTREPSTPQKAYPTRRCSARISSSKTKLCTPQDFCRDVEIEPTTPKSISVRAIIPITQTVMQIDSDTESIESPEELHVKSSRKTSTDLSEMEIISLYEPKKLTVGASPNPGLETLPPSFNLDKGLIGVPKKKKTFSKPHYRSVKYEWVMPNILDSPCSLVQGSWTIAKLTSSQSDNYTLRFDDQTAFDMESLPYRDLCFALNIKKTVPITPLVPKIPKLSKTNRQNANKKVKRMKSTRSLTHLNVDFWGIGDRPEASANFLGVPMAAGDELAKLRKRNTHDSMSHLIERRFIIAVIVIRALTGGIECLTDWVLVSLLFPRFSLNFIRGHWKQLVIRHKKAIDRLETDFQNVFVPAYESGEIPRIDYDHLQDYDWERLVDWTMNTVDTSFTHRPVSMPNSRLELKNRYTLEILDHKESWRDKWLETNAAIYKRLDDACFHALATSIRKSRANPMVADRESSNLTQAKSWIRAVALSSPNDLENNADFMEATEKFGKKIADDALAELLGSKVIMHRSKKRVNLSTRDYEATELFSKSLRREVKPKCFRDASVFKRYMDSTFRSGTACIRVDYMAWEGDVMVISNLQAHGRIKLEAIGVPREKFGLTEGGYETKKIPRERLRFDMDVYPTSTYMYDDENPVLLAALAMGAPRGHQQALPVWFTISETLNRTLWKEVYSAVGQVMALHAGIDIPELVRMFSPTLEEWEIRLLLEWGQEVGLFRRLDAEIDGWTADEWWWAYAMTLFADDRFTVGQDVRFEPKNPFTIEGRREG